MRSTGYTIIQGVIVIMRSGFRHLGLKERIKLEGMVIGNLTQTKMAEELGVSRSTISRELKKGAYMKRDGATWKEYEAYSADLGQQRYEETWKNKGPALKVGKDWNLLRFIEDMILNHHYSPMAVLKVIEREKLKFDTKLSLSTIYNYIRDGIFLNLQLRHLPAPRREKGKKKKVQKREFKSRGTSIEERPKFIDDREEFGHWEMDSVVGKQGSKKAALVLTERMTRKEIIEPLKDHTAREVVRALNRIEREYGDKVFRMIFRSITVDNGVEFSDVKGMETSRRNKTKRTRVFYCHPYSSYERGSNENQNRLIRRWIPKGTTFDNITRRELKEIEKWMNHYPREMFGHGTSEELYVEEVAKLVA